jgi:cyclohexyl-isocyanide hydratase
MILGIPVYNGVDLLDVMGPYEMFKWVPAELGLEVYLLSADGCPVTSINGVKFSVHGGFVDYPRLDVLWVPGGDPDTLGKMMSVPDSLYFRYLRQVAADATWVCSVCEGALLAGRAGLFEGHTVTTHWAFVSCLARFTGVTPAPGHPRFVRSGNRLTGGGISSGLDESLELIRLLFGEAVATDVQLTTQYFPKPPVSAQIPTETPACPVHWN